MPACSANRNRSILKLVIALPPSLSTGYFCEFSQFVHDNCVWIQPSIPQQRNRSASASSSFADSSQHLPTEAFGSSAAHGALFARFSGVWNCCQSRSSTNCRRHHDRIFAMPQAISDEQRLGEMTRNFARMTGE